MDKSAFSIARLSDEPDDKRYWLSRSSDERLEALEMMRQINYNYDPSTCRLQRFFEIAEFPLS